MATDPNIILAAGQINDPARLAQSQMAQLQLQQAQQAMRGQNALKQVFAQPGAMTPDGQVSQNALAQIMRVDPETGLNLARQNRAAMLDQLHIQAAQLGNQLSQTEIGKAKWDFLTQGAALATDAYDNAKKSGASEELARAAATRARDEYLDSNGGQLSEQEEQSLKSAPFDPDKVRAYAAQNKTWLAGKKEDERFAEEVRRDDATIASEKAHLALDTRRENFEEHKPQVVGADSGLYIPGKGFVDPSEMGSGGAYTGGLTPRKSNGGDNPDPIVDKKIDFIATKLGVDPDAPLTPQQLLAFRSAYIQTEGSKTNNVGNLKNVSGAGFQTFPTKQAGLAAITAQISRDYARGQTSIRKLIEGVPQGGGRAGSEAELAKGIANYTIAPLSGFALRSARGQRIMAEVEKLNPNYDQTQYDEKKRFMSEMGSARPGSAGGATRTLNVAINHLYTLQQLAAALGNGNVKLFNRIGQYWAEQTGDPAPTNFDGAKVIVGREVAKAITGAGGSVTEAMAVEEQLSHANSPKQLIGLLQQYRQLFGGQLGGLKQQYEQATGRKDFNRYLSAETLKEIGSGQSQPSSGWGKFSVVGE